MARFAHGIPAHLWIAVLISLSYSCFTGFLRIYARVSYYGVDDVAIAVAHVSVQSARLAGTHILLRTQRRKRTISLCHLAQLSFDTANTLSS